MDQWLLNPPVAFGILLLVIGLLAWACKRLAYRPGRSGAGLGKPYACGEETPDAMIQPDYSQFFTFAVFFTILHVVALMATTVPTAKASAAATVAIALVYLTGAVTGLLVLYRR